MLMAALWSRLCVVPQALHVQLRSASVRSSFIKPHTLQVLLEGYHLSILAKVFPCDVSLYSNIVRNIPKPLSLVDFPNFREPAKPRKLISSTNTASYCLAIAVLTVLDCKRRFWRLRRVLISYCCYNIITIFFQEHTVIGNSSPT